MSKRHPRARWVLPDVVDPDERVCYIVPVPNDRHHIANFLGAVAALASAYNWADDDDHTAVLAASVWFEIFDGLLQRSCALIGGDDVQFRQNGCKLEFSIDCVHWSTLYDPTNCIAAGTTQPPGDGELDGGECREFTVTLQGNGIYLLPVPVEEGYTVTISDASGGWNDGSGAGGWYCPDGTPYILGACAGARGHVGGDPDAISYHGELVARYNGQYVGASSGSFVIPPGEVLEALEFVMNDGSIGDNAGSITFKVQVCATAVPTFSHTFDFTIDDQGWTIRASGEGVYAAGVGWHEGGGGANERCVIQHTVPSGVTITGMVATYDWTFGSGNIAIAGHLQRTFLGATQVSLAQITAQGTNQTATLSMSDIVDLLELNLYACENFCSDGSVTIKQIVVTGLGTDPF